MKTVTGTLVTTKPISYSNAAKYSSRFTDSDNGASPALDIFLHRATQSFNNLVGVHKQFKARCESDGENPQGEKSEKRERKGMRTDGLEVKNEEIRTNEQIPDGIAGKKRKKGKKSEDFEQVIVKRGKPRWRY